MPRAVVPAFITVSDDPAYDIGEAIVPHDDHQPDQEPRLRTGDVDATRPDPVDLVSSWLRGRSFALGVHPRTNYALASELIEMLRRAGFRLDYVD
jgi:hypothetical protein